MADLYHALQPRARPHILSRIFSCCIADRLPTVCPFRHRYINTFIERGDGTPAQKTLRPQRGEEQRAVSLPISPIPSARIQIANIISFHSFSVRPGNFMYHLSLPLLSWSWPPGVIQPSGLVPATYSAGFFPQFEPSSWPILFRSTIPTTDIIPFPILVPDSLMSCVRIPSHRNLKSILRSRLELGWLSNRLVLRRDGPFKQFHSSARSSPVLADWTRASPQNHSQKSFSRTRAGRGVGSQAHLTVPSLISLQEEAGLYFTS